MIIALLLLLLLSTSVRAQEGFSQDSALASMRQLTNVIGPRPMGSPAEQRALRFAVDRFRDYGCDTSFIIPFRKSGEANTTSGIAVGISYGKDSGSICIGAHIDSEGPEIEGANDNASGTAVVLELARILARSSHHSTFIFCCFGGEEEGLEGSEYFVNHFDRIGDINLMIQIDMADGAGAIYADPHTYGASGPAWLVSATFEEARRLSITDLVYPTHAIVLNYLSPVGAGSDHGSFLSKGIPAISFTSDLNYPIHTPRDVLELFTPSGLERSGTLAAALVRRFDDGIPERSTEQYLLFRIGSLNLFLTPVWMTGWVLLAAALGLIALIGARRRMIPSDSTTRIRWSTAKGVFLAGIVLLFAWGSADIAGLIKGVRLPWFASPRTYWWLAAAFGLVGLWAAARVEERLPLSGSPYALFSRCYLLLIAGIALSLPFSLSLAFYPAASLVLLSLGMMIRFAPVRVVFGLAAVWFPARLIFSEWGEFWFRTIGTGLASGRNELLVFAVKVALPALILVMILPLMFGALAIVRDSPPLRNRGGILRSIRFLLPGAMLSIVFLIIAVRSPAYTERWNTPVTITHRFNMDDSTKQITLRSPEYLRGIRVSSSGYDTTIDVNATTCTLEAGMDFDTGMLAVERKTSDGEGDSLATDIHLTLRCSERPLTVRITLRGIGESPLTLETPFCYREERNGTALEWYAFPDSVLGIPFRVTRKQRMEVEETIEVTFARPAQPMHLERDFTTFIARTVVTTYRRYGK